MQGAHSSNLIDAQSDHRSIPTRLIRRLRMDANSSMQSMGDLLKKQDCLNFLQAVTGAEQFWPGDATVLGAKRYVEEACRRSEGDEQKESFGDARSGPKTYPLPGLPGHQDVQIFMKTPTFLRILVLTVLVLILLFLSYKCSLICGERRKT